MEYSIDMLISLFATLTSISDIYEPGSGCMLKKNSRSIYLWQFVLSLNMQILCKRAAAALSISSTGVDHVNRNSSRLNSIWCDIETIWTGKYTLMEKPTTPLNFPKTTSTTIMQIKYSMYDYIIYIFIYARLIWTYKPWK